MRVNRADQAAAEMSGLPPEFYSLKRRLGEETALTWLGEYQALGDDDLPWSPKLYECYNCTPGAEYPVTPEQSGPDYTLCQDCLKENPAAAAGLH